MPVCVYICLWFCWMWVRRLARAMFTCMVLLLLDCVLSVCAMYTAVLICGRKKCRRPWLFMPCMMLSCLVKCLSVPVCIRHCARYWQLELLLCCRLLLLCNVFLCWHILDHAFSEWHQWSCDASFSACLFLFVCLCLHVGVKVHLRWHNACVAEDQQHIRM